MTPGHEKKQLKINLKEWVEFIQTEEYGLSSETAVLDIDRCATQKEKESKG